MIARHWKTPVRAYSYAPMIFGVLVSESKLIDGFVWLIRFLVLCFIFRQQNVDATGLSIGIEWHQVSIEHIQQFINQYPLAVYLIIIFFALEGISR